MGGSLEAPHSKRGFELFFSGQASREFEQAVKGIESLRPKDSEFYHGTTVSAAFDIASHGIRLGSRYNYNSDFCTIARPGFYVTSFLLQAGKWAKAMHERRSLPPSIVVFGVPMKLLEKFNWKRFGPGQYDEWLKFVYECRTGQNHSYDLVEGPYLYNPPVLNEEYYRKFFEASPAIQANTTNDVRVRAVPAGHQLCVCSQDVADVFSKHIIKRIEGEEFAKSFPP